MMIAPKGSSIGHNQDKLKSQHPWLFFFFLNLYHDNLRLSRQGGWRMLLGEGEGQKEFTESSKWKSQLKRLDVALNWRDS